jgi:hypothetical protein
MNSAPQVAIPKKQYQKPALKVYGSIQALTANVSNTSSTFDTGGSGTMIKTH